MLTYRYRGAFWCAGLLACTLFPCLATETNSLAASRPRDEKSAMVNLALQIAQQLQTQQQQTEAVSRRAAESVASLRRLTLFVGASLGSALLVLLLYTRRVLRLLQQRPPSAHPAEEFVRKGAALEKLNRLEEALSWYEQAIARDAGLTDAYVGKGRVLNQLERYDEALACYERASQLQAHQAQ